MGSQVPDVPVRFAASFGRRLLYDPTYNKLGPICRCAWFEANLIATEFDGRFPVSALEARLSLLREDPTPILTRLREVGLISIERNREWGRITGWEKYQSAPDRPKTSTERVRRHRAKKRAETHETLQPLRVTPRARTSESSSESKRPLRKRTNGSTGEKPMPMVKFGEAMEKAGLAAHLRGRPRGVVE